MTTQKNLGRRPGRPKKIALAGLEIAAVNEEEGPVVIRLNIPRDLYASYAALAEKQGLTPAELMQHRLERCSSHSSIRPLYFPDSQRAQLETLLQKRPVETPEQALALLAGALSVGVGELAVPITPAQAKRLKLSAYAGMTVQDRLTQIVQTALARSLGV